MDRQNTDRKIELSEIIKRWLMNAVRSLEFGEFSGRIDRINHTQNGLGIFRAEGEKHSVAARSKQNVLSISTCAPSAASSVGSSDRNDAN